MKNKAENTNERDIGRWEEHSVNRKSTNGGKTQRRWETITKNIRYQQLNTEHNALLQIWNLMDFYSRSTPYASIYSPTTSTL